MTRWTANDYAFLAFGIYKGYSHKEISQVLDRSENASIVADSKLGKFRKTNMQPSNQLEKTMLKALQLEMKVRSGELKDIQEKWIAQLNRTRGIATQFVPQKEESIKIPEPPLGGAELHPRVATGDDSYQSLPSLISINIQVDSLRLEKLLGRIFGNV